MVDFTRVLGNVPQDSPTAGSIGRVDSSDRSKDAIVSGILGLAGLGVNLYNQKKESDKQAVVGEFAVKSAELLDPAGAAQESAEKVQNAMGGISFTDESVSAPMNTSAGPVQFTEDEQAALKTAQRSAERLVAGEQQGVLSSEAIARRRIALFTEYQAKYPQLTDEFYRIYARNQNISKELDQMRAAREVSQVQAIAETRKSMEDDLRSKGYSAALLAMQRSGGVDDVSLSKFYEQTVGQRKRAVEDVTTALNMMKNNKEITQIKRQEEVDKAVYVFGNVAVTNLVQEIERIQQLPEEERKAALESSNRTFMAKLGTIYQDNMMETTEEDNMKRMPVYASLYKDALAAFEKGTSDEVLKGLRTRAEIASLRAAEELNEEYPSAAKIKALGGLVKDLGEGDKQRILSGPIERFVAEGKVTSRVMDPPRMDKYGNLTNNDKLESPIIGMGDQKTLAEVSGAISKGLVLAMKSGELNEEEASGLIGPINRVLNTDLDDPSGSVLMQIMPALADPNIIQVYSKSGGTGQSLVQKAIPRVDTFVENVLKTAARREKELGVDVEVKLDKDTGEIMFVPPENSRAQIKESFSFLAKQLTNGVRAREHLNGSTTYNKSLLMYGDMLKKYL